MMLVWLILVPLLGGVVAWLLDRWSQIACRWVALLALGLELLLALSLWGQTPMAQGRWITQVQVPWIPQLGISFHLALDGLSLVFVLLTGVLGMVAVVASWTSIQDRVGFFHLQLLWVLAGVVGVFLAVDLFLFYFFWELMLVPMYFLIDLWGHENRHYAAVKFFLFTQLSGLFLLLAILALFFAHGRNTGVYTFDYVKLLGTTLTPRLAWGLMLGFFVAFAVKLPAVPFHPWLPDAHTEAPTGASIVLAGLLLKTGGYGLIRFAVPLFPQAAREFAPVAMILAVIGILYGAFLAFAQTDLKRLVAYTSVSHLGFVLLGIFAWNRLALQGAILQMVCHGLSTGALFFLVGSLQERLGTRDLRRLGGLWSVLPKMGAAFLIFALASLGLPGLGNFVAEFLVLLGVFQVSPVLAVIATGGLVLATVYALWIMHRVFFGPQREHWRPRDLHVGEIAAVAAMFVLLLWLGLLPQPLLNLSGRALDRLQGSGQVMMVEVSASNHSASGGDAT